MIHSGGTISVAKNLAIGNNLGATATFNMTDGKLNAKDNH